MGTIGRATQDSSKSTRHGCFSWNKQGNNSSRALMQLQAVGFFHYETTKIGHPTPKGTHFNFTQTDDPANIDENHQPTKKKIKRVASYHPT